MSCQRRELIRERHGSGLTVPGAGVERRAAQDEAKYGHRFGNSNVPTASQYVRQFSLFHTLFTHQVRSLNRPDDHDHAIEMAPAIRYGGHVSTSVISWLNPSVLMAVGKKFLKPFAPR